MYKMEEETAYEINTIVLEKMYRFYMSNDVIINYILILSIRKLMKLFMFDIIFLVIKVFLITKRSL